MEIFLRLLQITLFAYLVGGLVASVYSLWSGRDWNKEPLFGLKYIGNTFIYSGAFFAILVILSEGMETLLFFIPDNWGSVDEYGEWSSTKGQMSMLFSLLITIFLFVYVGKSEEAKRKLRDEDRNKPK